MERDKAIELLKRHERELRRMGVSALALFGSTARGDPRPDSDLDVLIDIEPNREFSLFDLAGVHLYLSDLFGREADVVIRRDSKSNFQERIAREKVPVF